MPVSTSEEGMELQVGKDLLVKCKRTKFSVPIVQSQQEVEVSDMDKLSHVLLHKVSAGKDPMNCIKDHAHGTLLTARSRLPKICNANGWRGPSYDFEEQGLPHNKLFSCKVTVHVKGMVDTVLECFGDPKSRKKTAQEHAAQGALWYLCHLGRVK